MIKYTKDELCYIVLDSLEGFEYKHKMQIVGLYKKPGDIFENSVPAMKYVCDNLSEGLVNCFKGVFLVQKNEYVKYLLEKLEKRKIEAITCISDDYPEYLKNYPFYPLIIYAKGNKELLKSKRKLAIVGSRKTLPFVLKRIEEISGDLATNGVTIVTGCALGGDRSALLGGEKSGNVISILASGHDFIYPQSNRSLIDKISDNGLVISEYPPETTSSPWRFPMRNRLISALSTSVLIASGEFSSGTRHTAKFAEAFSKKIYAFPYSISEKSGEICNQLIKMGKANLIENSEDIALLEGIKIEKETNIDLEESEIEVLSKMDGECDIDSLSEKTGMQSYEVMAILSMLEIKGAVCKGEQNLYTALIKVKDNKEKEDY